MITDYDVFLINLLLYILEKVIFIQTTLSFSRIRVSKNVIWNKKNSYTQILYKKIKLV